MRNLGEFCKKMDRICADLNVFLVVLAVGLGCLVVTCWLSNMIIRDVRMAKVGDHREVVWVSPQY